MARAIFRAQTSGATRAARDLSRAARELRTIMLSQLREAGPELEALFRDYAPYDITERDDYHLEDHITVAISTVGRIRATVKAEAISPENRFDYLDVTRFGHPGRIRPRRKSWLKWTELGVSYFARDTAGHHPRSDWVEDAQPEADAFVGEIADRLGRTIYTRLLA